MRLIWPLVVVVMLVLGGAPVSVHADPVQVRVATNAQGSRLAFIWDSPVTYQANLAGQQLVLSFGRPMEADFSVISGGLPGFVTGTDVSADTRQITLSLTSVFELVHFPAGNAVVVDLIGKPFEGEPVVAQTPTETVSAPTPTPSPEPTSTPEITAAPSIDAGSLPQVGIRTGLHADKLRLVFDWDAQVPYTLERQGNVATFTFDRAVGMDVSGLSRVEPNILGDAHHRVTQQGTVVSLAVAEGAEIKDFYAGSKIVADIVFPTDGSTAGKLPAVTDVAISEPVETNEPAPEATVDVAPEATPETAPEPVEEVAQASTQEQSLNAAAEVEQPATPEPAASASASGDQPLDLTTATPPASSSGNGAGLENITSATSGGDGGFTLRFEWSEPVAASVFRRGEALWVVFDRPSTVDVAAIQGVAGDQISEMVQIPHPVATVLRTMTKRGVNPVLEREGLTWVLDFAEQSLTTLSPVATAAQPDSPVGARIFLPVPEPGKAVSLVDPDMGEYFVTVPVLPLGYGVTNLYEYPQFRIRPSSQGIVIEPLIDTLRIRPVRQGIGITSTRTLEISPTTDLDMARAQSDSDRPMSRIADFEPLQNVSVEFFNDERQELEHTIAVAPSRTKRAEARFELVRFFLAHGYSAEALGVLRVIADETPLAKKRGDYRLYRGIANFFLNRLENARVDFQGEQLDNNDEGLFWRSMVEFVDGNEPADVMRGIRSTAHIPDPYPRAMRIPLAMDVIEATIRVGDADRAQEFVESLGAEDLGPKERGEWLYLSGMKDEAAGDFEAAVSSFEMAIVGEHRPSRIFARVSRAELLLEMERTNTMETIDELEKLRFAWRGGTFEFDLLRRLGDLYLTQGGFRQGLSTLRQAATYFRERDDAEQITQRMSDTFAYLYLKDGADRLPPITAIALYDEFKELTPVGDLGDEMIQKLADRLVKVDLLNEAAALLDGQVKFRLQGTEKSRVGAQLAIVRLIAKDYDGALKALDLTEGEGLSPELINQRTQLRARAQMGVGDDAGALLLLDEDESREAEQLRAETFWTAKDWPRAAQSLRNIIRMDDIAQNQPLEPSQAINILNYSIALTLSGNDRGLAQVRERYGAAMRATDLKDAFILIATPEQFGLIAYDSIPSKVRVAENFQTFLAAYKERLENEALSQIN
jgi:tetratricopeptide (TPR) repeat protein